MKHLVKRASLALGMLAVTANSALAQSGFFNNPQGGTGSVDVATTRTLGDAVTGIINWARGILGLVAVIMLIYAGIRLVTSRGDEAAYEESKKTILYLAFGLIIIILSWTIVQFIVGALTN